VKHEPRLTRSQVIARLLAHADKHGRVTNASLREHDRIVGGHRDRVLAISCQRSTAPTGWVKLDRILHVCSAVSLGKLEGSDTRRMPAMKAVVLVILVLCTSGCKNDEDRDLRSKLADGERRSEMLKTEAAALAAKMCACPDERCMDAVELEARKWRKAVREEVAHDPQRFYNSDTHVLDMDHQLEACRANLHPKP
jgi:hypothetical protein